MKSILIVDDELGIAETLCDLFVNVGYDVDKAWNGQLALKKTAEHPPDLIVADVMMPIMDGLQMLRALKANPESRDIPVVLMTAATTFDKSCPDGTAGFLTKPFELKELLTLVKQLIGAPAAVSDQDPEGSCS